MSSTDGPGRAGGEGLARVAFADCYSGASGDMLLGALLDAGVALDALRDGLRGLGLGGEFTLEAEPVQRAGVRALKARVRTGETRHHRPYRDVVATIEAAGLPDRVRARSLAVMGRLAAEEGRIHGAPPEEVELHEVGAVDSIVDVVGTVLGLELLGIEELRVSAVPGAPGRIASSGHRLPSPAPATLAVLAGSGIVVRPFGDGRELVTPTGAALLATLGRPGQPAMVVERVGYGAGDADLPWPNVLRLWVGTTPPGGPDPEPEAHVVLETNVDDMSPQLLAPVVDALLADGALDVTLTPVQMKKGRPAVTVGVIARRCDEPRLARRLLVETTTLGVRVHPVSRHEAGRDFVLVATSQGEVTVKRKILDGRVVGVMPEFESVREVAREHEVPVADLHAEAMAAARAQVGRPARA